MKLCEKVLYKIRNLLQKDAKFVFAVDTIANRCSDDSDYKIVKSVKTTEGFDLLLKCKNYYDATSQTQYSPSIYELYNGNVLLQQEEMDFQIHLYRLGEIEPFLYNIGFKNVAVYASFDKKPAIDNKSEAFLYECSC